MLNIVNYTTENNIPALEISGVTPFSVEKTFDCGQCFGFDSISDNSFAGAAFGKNVTFTQSSQNSFKIIGSTVEDFENIWRNYLDLDEDYDAANNAIIEAVPTKYRDFMAQAVECGNGIRILRQDKWEALVSFIVSQNNNIPRIKKILRALCEKCGVDGKFPTAEAILSLGEDGLFELRTGFRAKYIYDAALKISSGEIALDEVDACDYDKAAEILCSIKGVGPKVSACVLLFGFHKTEAFPVDVWMRRSLERHFPDGIDVKAFGKYAGLAQQYLFYYERWHGEA